MKYLILLGILFLAYRFVLKPSLNPPSSEQKQPNIQEQESSNEGEYIDYEEVD